MSIAINLSPVQFQHGDLTNLVHQVCSRPAVAKRLELEITKAC